MLASLSPQDALWLHTSKHTLDMAENGATVPTLVRDACFTSDSSKTFLSNLFRESHKRLQAAATAIASDVPHLLHPLATDASVFDVAENFLTTHLNRFNSRIPKLTSIDRRWSKWTPPKPLSPAWTQATSHSGILRHHGRGPIHIQHVIEPTLPTKISYRRDGDGVWHLETSNIDRLSISGLPDECPWKEVVSVEHEPLAGITVNGNCFQVKGWTNLRLRQGLDGAAWELEPDRLWFKNLESDPPSGYMATLDGGWGIVVAYDHTMKDAAIDFAWELYRVRRRWVLLA
ncbi:hypothetical protein M427DRAFT_133860 [Gonapodya prolifera JEL478]|uniref:Uncharacterized protein n=1 Tax=Gonapodya prolifera (strain JEL478) TaxID=1344416 RepID=A0A139AIZ4_GONPJ|nr:hypothetical protein M427DRAFT_133860 [Gonapodya prolifera JEL478]|eukprot:KXS16781.1 hypothetical protein M427DRAFT_133860 [Gonapodya prolifera JEL478]